MYSSNIDHCDGAAEVVGEGGQFRLAGTLQVANGQLIGRHKIRLNNRIQVHIGGVCDRWNKIGGTSFQTFCKQIDLH